MRKNQGIPWEQITTTGTTMGTYRVRPGQTLQDVTDAVHGPGASCAAIVAAHPQINLAPGLISPGALLAIPPAGRAGPPPPGGPAGNGVGGGSYSQPPSTSTRARRANCTTSYAVPGGQAMSSTMSKEQTKTAQKQKRSGR